MKKRFYYLLLSISPLLSMAQATTLPEVTIRGTEVRVIESAIVANTHYEIHISLPENYSANNGSYPVLYYLDAYHWGGIVIETYRLLRAFNEIKPLILVGISYKNASREQEYFNRSRDLMPTVVTEENKGPYGASVPRGALLISCYL